VRFVVAGGFALRGAVVVIREFSNTTLRLADLESFGDLGRLIRFTSRDAIENAVGYCAIS
jgi:hypothetical protein